MTNARPESWFDGRTRITDAIAKTGGWTNAHAHLDRAFTLTARSFPLTAKTLKEKWSLVDAIKRRSSVDDIYGRMAAALEHQMAQGVTGIGSFIDVDGVVRDKAIRAAQKIRDRYGSAVRIKFVNQTLKGVLDPDARKWFDIGAQFADIIGGLPGKDAGREGEHLDVVLGTAKRMGKMAHVHVDQFNAPDEEETALLVNKTHEHGMEGKVAAIHGISIAAKDEGRRNALYADMKRAGVTLITCPTAWIDSRRNETLAPTHNAIAPVEELMGQRIPVAIGSDNIGDIYKPFTDGDMWTELRFLLESCHYYDIPGLVRIASSNGRKALGIV